MRSSRFGFLGLALLALTGCGTVHNLKDRPNGPVFVGTGRCYPFGGIVRSGLLAVMGPPLGTAEVIAGNLTVIRGDVDAGLGQVGQGMLLASAGLVAIADTPLSLAGDVLTLPVAYARYKEYGWATWWGEGAIPDPSARLVPESDEADAGNDAGVGSSD